MVGTICLAGRERGRGRGAILRDAATFTAAAAAAGAITSTLAALVGTVIHLVPGGGDALLGTAVIMIGLVVGEGARKMSFAPLGLHRQVRPGTMLRHSSHVTSAIWGFQIGLGAITWVNTWSFWAMLSTVAWLANPTTGLAAGTVYGLARGLQPFSTAAIAHRDVKRVTALVYSGNERGHLAAIVGIMALAVVIATALH